MTAPSSCSSQRGILRQGFPQQEPLSPPSNQASLVFLPKPVRRCVCVCVCVGGRVLCPRPSCMGSSSLPPWGTQCSWRGHRPLQLAQSRSSRWAQSPSELEGGPFTSPRPASLLTDGETEAQRGKRRTPHSHPVTYPDLKPWHLPWEGKKVDRLLFIAHLLRARRLHLNRI